jgi:hypothetical protein
MYKELSPLFSFSFLSASCFCLLKLLNLIAFKNDGSDIFIVPACDSKEITPGPEVC